MRALLAIIGQPGAGKTTALRLALRGVPRMIVMESIPPFVVYPGGAQLGLERSGGFAGSDAYPLNVQARVINWLHDAPFPAVVTEGDRLTNDGLFLVAQDFGYDLQVAWIDTPDEIAAERRAARGATQDPAWVKGRQTKVIGLAERWIGSVIVIDGAQAADQVAADLAKTTVIRRIRGDE